MLPVLVSLLEECRPEWRDEMIDELAQVLDRQSEITFNISREASDDGTRRADPDPRSGGRTRQRKPPNCCLRSLQPLVASVIVI